MKFKAKDFLPCMGYSYDQANQMAADIANAKLKEWLSKTTTAILLSKAPKFSLLDAREAAMSDRDVHHDYSIEAFIRGARWQYDQDQDALAAMKAKLRALAAKKLEILLLLNGRK